MNRCLSGKGRMEGGEEKGNIGAKVIQSHEELDVYQMAC